MFSDREYHKTPWHTHRAIPRYSTYRPFRRVTCPFAKHNHALVEWNTPPSPPSKRRTRPTSFVVSRPSLYVLQLPPPESGKEAGPDKGRVQTRQPVNHGGCGQAPHHTHAFNSADTTYPTFRLLLACAFPQLFYSTPFLQHFVALFFPDSLVESIFHSKCRGIHSFFNLARTRAALCDWRWEWGGLVWCQGRCVGWSVPTCVHVLRAVCAVRCGDRGV
jgi:hypothetical protein